MPNIYDNIEKHLEEGLNKTLETSVRGDFCIGYFNLRGWRKIADTVDKLEGDYLAPEYSSAIEAIISNKVFGKSEIGFSFVSASSRKIYYRIGGGRYWKIFTTFQPKFVVEGSSSVSSRESYLHFDTDQHLNVAVTSLSSSLFFWYFQITTNGRDLNPFDLKSFPIDYDNGYLQKSVSSLANEYMDDVKENKKQKEKTSKLTGHILYEEFYPRKSKPIIDQIDTVLAEHYGFTEAELDFIINYDIKYRMGKALFGEADESKEDED